MQQSDCLNIKCMNPVELPVVGSMSLLEHVRADLDRLSPEQAFAEQRSGALLIDVRTDPHRAEAAGIPGAIAVDLTVLPWRLDPGFSHRIPEATGFDRRVILFCRHGYSSSLAAWNLRQMGLHRATDIVGGFDAWAAAGLPLHHGAIDVRP